MTMDAMMNSTADPPPASSSCSITHRLQSAKKAIFNATKEALKSAEFDQTLQTEKSSDTVLPSSVEDIVSDSDAFDVGMTLFGDDIITIELEMGAKLTKVEHELQSLISLDQQHHNNCGDEDVVMSPQENFNDDNSSMNADTEKSGAAILPNSDKALQQEANELVNKINFLKDCSAARVALEEATTLSHQTTSSNSNIQDKGVLVRMAECLARATQSLDQAEKHLQAHRHSHKDNDENNENIHQASRNSDVMNEQDLDIAHCILDSISNQIRRKKVDVHAKAAALLDNCIIITKTSIAIREASTSTSATNNKSLNTSSSSHESEGSNSHTNVNSTSSNLEDMNDAFDALEILSSCKTTTTSSNNNDDETDSTLQDYLRILAQNISTLVIQPQITLCQDCFQKGTPLPTWQLRESFTTNKNSSSSTLATGGGDTSTTAVSSSKGKGRFSTKTLEWRHVILDDEKNKTTTTNSTTAIIRGNHKWWLDLIKFIQSIMAFIQENVFQGRNGLCHIIGHIIFGGEGGCSQQLPSSSSQHSNGRSEKTQFLQSIPILKNIYKEQSGILSLLSTLMWERCIPNSPDELLSQPTPLSSTSTTTSAQEELCESTKGFEQALIDRGFITTTSSLTDYANNFLRTYAEKQRSIILSKGRDLLLNNDYHNTTQVGIDVHSKQMEIRPRYMDLVDGADVDNEDMSVFVLHQSAVSNIALDLMELCTKTMDAAVAAVDPSSSSNATELAQLVPPALYRVSRELLDLFRAIIPAAHGSEISNIPRTAAILHNDCVFFANKLLTFGLEYRDKFPTTVHDESSASASSGATIKKLCTFVDLVPTFRELAQTTMGDMIQRQKAQIAEIVSPRITYIREALRSSEGVVEWTDAETALTTGLYHLRHLSQAWKGVLSHDIYGRSMGNLVDMLFSLFLDQVLKTKDISEPACNFVSTLFRNALLGVKELFESSSSSSVSKLQESGAKEGEDNDDDEATKEMSKFCNLSSRFTAVGKFMEMSLADITVGLGDGVFRSVTGPEVSKLIVAVFEDSEKRRNLLHLLASE